MISALVVFELLCSSGNVAAQEGVAHRADRFEISARSQSYVHLFRRALLPGPNGALVETETLVPVYEYLSLRAQRLDAPWSNDSVDIEVAGWVRGLPMGGHLDPAANGDVQTAFVSVRERNFEVRAGRQQVVGGAARFTRFDGLLLTLGGADGLTARAYAGFTVLPRWNERPSYQHLGSSADVLLRDASAADDAQRHRSWLGGASLDYRARGFSMSASFHEQRDGGALARRDWGLDAQAFLSKTVSLGGSGVLDSDSARLADARLWLDLEPARPLSLTFEYLHTEPALWLSRQSVLAVFSSSHFDEAGVGATLRLNRQLLVEASSFATLYEAQRPGARADMTLRISAGYLTAIRLGYRRVLTGDNGYHALRASLQQQLAAPLVATLESYQYLYDREIAGYGSSSVYAGALSFLASETWNVLWGASISRSPYAALDAQSLVRLELVWDAAVGAAP